MTDPHGDSFDALRLPAAPLMPRPQAVTDLRARVHRRLGLAVPLDHAPMRNAGGLEYETGGHGAGEAVLLMHAGTATAYLPLMREPALVTRYQLVRYHRRGYAGSDGFHGSLPIRRHVDDALALLDHLGIEQAHVVGHSGSGVIALELALVAPERVRSLVLEEPAIHAIDLHWGDLLRDAISRPLERQRAGDTRGAMEMWMRAISPRWRADLTRTVPGGPQQTLADAGAFFADVEGVVDWSIDDARLGLITMPVLYVIAGERPFHRTVLRRFRELVPQTETAVITEATHMLHTDRPTAVAAELAGFFARHSGET